MLNNLVLLCFRNKANQSKSKRKFKLRRKITQPEKYFSIFNRRENKFRIIKCKMNSKLNACFFCCCCCCNSFLISNSILIVGHRSVDWILVGRQVAISSKLIREKKNQQLWPSTEGNASQRNDYDAREIRCVAFRWFGVLFVEWADCFEWKNAHQLKLYL